MDQGENHVSTQADTVSCQSKLKRVEGKYQTAGGVLIVWYDPSPD